MKNKLLTIASIALLPVSMAFADSNINNTEVKNPNTAPTQAPMTDQSKDHMKKNDMHNKTTREVDERNGNGTLNNNSDVPVNNNNELDRPHTNSLESR